MPMPMPWLEDMGMKDGSSSIFPGLSLVQWMSMQQQQHGFQTSNIQPAAIVSSNSISFEDPSKLLSFQSPHNSGKPNQRNQLVSPLQQLSPPWPQHQHQQQQSYHQQQNYAYNQLQQQKPQPQQQISGLANRNSLQPLQHHTEHQQQTQMQVNGLANRNLLQPLQHHTEHQQQTQMQVNGLSNRNLLQPLQHQMEQQQQQQQQQRTQLQQALQQQQILQNLHQHHLFSPVEPLQQQVIQQLKQQQQVSSNNLSTATLVQSNQQHSQYKPLRVHPPGDGDVPSCSTSPSTSNCQLTPSNFRIRNQQGPSSLGDNSMLDHASKFLHELQSQSKSDTRVKHELSNSKLLDQSRDKAIATEPTTSVTSYCLDTAGGGLPHNYNIPNLCVEGDVAVHSQSRSDLSFGANIDSLPPDALLSRGFDCHNMMSNYISGGSRDIETELSAAEISPESFGMPDMSFKPNDNNIAGGGAKDTSVAGNGMWSNNQTQQQQQPRMRTYTKVQKRGSVGRTIDVTRYKGYEELRHDLARMFGIEGELEDTQRMEWKLVYVDHENDILLVGDDPWEEFVSCVQSIKILSYSEVQKMSLDGNLGNVRVPHQASSGTDSGRAPYDDNSAASFNR